MREIAEESPGEFSQKISRIYSIGRKNQHHFSTACEQYRRLAAPVPNVSMYHSCRIAG